jgi:hypothetical protein
VNQRSRAFSTFTLRDPVKGSDLMMTLTRPSLTAQAENGGDVNDLTFVVAREGSELAMTLREKGWTARAGWRSRDDSGEPVWLVRFQRPAGSRHD